MCILGFSFAGILFPLFSITYIVAPHSSFGQTMRKPFIKFICHSASYFTFLCEYSAYNLYQIKLKATCKDYFVLNLHIWSKVISNLPLNYYVHIYVFHFVKKRFEYTNHTTHVSRLFSFPKFNCMFVWTISIWKFNHVIRANRCWPQQPIAMNLANSFVNVSFSTNWVGGWELALENWRKC